VGITSYYVSENNVSPNAYGPGWISVTSSSNYSEDVPFTLSNSYGSKTIYVWFKDESQNVSSFASDSISYSFSPILLGSFNTPGKAEAVFVSGNYAYVADKDSLQIIDIFNLAAPVFAGSYYTSGYANDVFVKGNQAFVSGTSNGVEIINVSNPNSPALLSSYNTPGGSNGARGVFASDNYVYVGDGSEGLHILDIFDP
jgi:hypothetical protein